MPESIILLAEDDENDIVLIRRAFDRAGIENPLFVVRDGEQTINYLYNIGKYYNRAEYPLPELLLLDLKMPRVDGFEVLRWLQTQPALRGLRAVVLTSSEAICDVNEAYRLGASSFLIKPLEFQNFVRSGELLRDYWLKVNKSAEVSRPSDIPRDMRS